MKKRRVLALAAVAVVVGACSAAARRPPRPPRPALPPSAAGSAAASEAASAARTRSALRRSARARAALNLVAWPGYVVGGTGGEQVTGYDWVTPFETATGCKVNVKVGVDSANMVQLMKTGQYDGVSASGDATLRLIAGGDVGVNLGLIPELQGRLRGPQEPDLQHRQRGQLRRAPRPRRQRPDVRPVDRHHRARLVERRLRRELAIQGQGHGLQLRHLHRRRGAVPDEDQARPRHQGPLRPGSGAVRRLGRAAQAAEDAGRQVLGATAQEAIDGFANGDMAIGTAWLYRRTPSTRAPARRSRASRPRRARRGGPTPGSYVQGRPPELHVQVRWTTSSPRRPTPTSRSTSVRRRSARRRASRPTSRWAGWCDQFHAAGRGVLQELYYWNTPTTECLDGRDPISKDFDAWTQAWTEITGGSPRSPSDQRRHAA